MAEKEQARQPTHRAYSVIRREGQDDFWLNVGLAFPIKMARASTSCFRRCHSTARSSAGRSPKVTTPAMAAKSRAGANEASSKGAAPAAAVSAAGNA
jgi:hypothetical protein